MARAWPQYRLPTCLTHGGQRETEKTPLAQQETPSAMRKQPPECRVAHVQAAGIGTKRRHHHPARVSDEAWAADRAAARRDRRLRMVMPDDLPLAGRSARLVAKCDRLGVEA